MSFCSHCGTKLEPKVKFCPSCGESVELEPVNQKPNREAVKNPEHGDDHPAHKAPPRPQADSPVPTANTLEGRPLEPPCGVAPSEAAPPEKNKPSRCAVAAIIGGGTLVFLIAIFSIVMCVASSATAGGSDKLDECLVRVRAGDVEGAYSMTSSGFREITPLEGFRQYLDSYPLIKNSTEAKYSDKRIENGVATLLGTLVDRAGIETRFTAQLIKEEDEWKLQLIQLPDAISEESEKLDEWLVKVRAGDVEGAYAMTSSGLRENTPLEGFRQFLDSYPVIKNSVNSTHSETTIENEVTTLLGTLVDITGIETRFAAQLFKEGEEWKMQSIQVPDAVSKSGTAMRDPAGSPAAKALEHHLSLLKQGNLTDAYQMTSQEFKAATTMDAYSQYLTSYPMIADVNSVEYEKGEGNEIAVMLYGLISDSKGQNYKFQAQMNRVNEKWLLHVISLPDSPQTSESEPAMQDVTLRSVSHPDYYLEYRIPEDWTEEADGSHFIAKPPKGSSYEGRVRMSIRAFPNQETKSPWEIRNALAESLAGLTDLIVDKRTLVMTTLEGDTVKQENELPAGQYGHFSDIVEYHFNQESTPWKGIEFGVMRHDDKGKLHYILSVRSEDSSWENLLPVMAPFLGMKLNYGTN